ncbi:MAG TPA: DUF4194 domain-containing protein [Ktedonosporobacter sp.]|jgi:hypothetical protein|nr:DUF4194 domain-containing protein [Ktedonosporobacter sp.]
MRANQVTPYAAVVIKLLQGPLYHDDTTTWNLLLQYGEQVQIFCAQMGLELRFHEEDGFAYVRQPQIEDDEGNPLELPRLTRRIPLSYHVTLLCVLLREQLLQFEATNMESTACLLTREQIYDMLLPSLPERTNELVVRRRADALIEQVVELGFLKKRSQLGVDYFEVRRILKAKLDAEQLSQLKERLKRYGTTEQQSGTQGEPEQA